MSIFDGDTPGQDSIAPEDAAQGPRLGFLSSLQQSYHTQLLTAGTYRVEGALQEQEAQQIELARQYGADLKPINTQQPQGSFALWNSDPYWRAANGMPGASGPDGSAPNNTPITTDNDRVLSDLAKKHPQAGFRTYAQMMQTVAANAQNAQFDEQHASHTWGGVIGSFLGSTGTALNMRYNNPAAAVAGAAPNLLAAGTGPLGIAARVGASGLINAGIAGVQNLTGDPQESRVLGMQSQSLGSAVGQGFVSGVALGAGGEVAGTALRLAGRRIAPWFESTPNDEAPTPPAGNQTETAASQGVQSENAPEGNQPVGPRPGYPGEGPDIAGPPVPPEGDPVIAAAQADQPYGPTREATSRVEQDLSSVTTQLDAWDGPAPSDVQPWAQDRFVGTPEARADMVRNGADLNEIARRVDPTTVTEFQNAGQRMADIRTQIAELQNVTHATTNDADIVQQRQALQQLDEQVAQLQQQADNAKGRRSGRATEQANDLLNSRAQLAEGAERATSGERTAHTSSQIEQLRQQLTQLDERRRDLAPLVSRAYRIAGDQINAVQPRPIEDVLPSIRNHPGNDTAERLAHATQDDVQQQTDEAARVVVQGDDEEGGGAGGREGQGDQGATLSGRMIPPAPRTIPDEIRLPSGRIVKASDVVSATRDENGNTQVTGTVRDLMREVDEAKQLAEASTSCAI